MKPILITNDPHLAHEAQEAGVSRIMVDLESIGKQARQASRRTFISTHRVEDILPVRHALTQAELIVRINPWHAGSLAEIEHAVASNADFVMLPMITDMRHLEALISYLKGRAKVLPLVETGYSMAHIADIAAHPGVHEVYIGLNDLHLSLGLEFLFEPLALGLVDWMAERIRAAGKPFGFGGITVMGNGEVPSEQILGEHARLGSSRVILSSRFWRDTELSQSQGRPARLKSALSELQSTYETLKQRTPAQQLKNTQEITALIKQLAAEKTQNAAESARMVVNKE